MGSPWENKASSLFSLAYQLRETQCEPNISHSVRPSPQNKINIRKDKGESRHNSSQDPFKCDSHCPGKKRGHSAPVSWHSTEQGRSDSHRRPLAPPGPCVLVLTPGVFWLSLLSSINNSDSHLLSVYVPGAELNWFICIFSFNT